MNVLRRVLSSVQRYPDQPALEIGERQWTYAELWSAAGAIARGITREGGKSAAPVALFASRSFATYAGILGILLAGRAYLPMNLKFPVARAARMMQLSSSDTVVLSDEFEGYYRRFVEVGRKEYRIIRVTAQIEMPVPDLKITLHKTADDTGAVLSNRDALPSLPAKSTETAYIMFTSGTTGEPKGIPVSHKNLDAFLDHIVSRYDINSNDRCSQTFDTTFDLSVHDIFVCWIAGACLCPLAVSDLLLPNKFITSRKLTVWYSVPSIALRMKQVRMLKPGSFPLLRYSFFCGEALPDQLASDWKMAAQNTKIMNLYGPTEATISIAEYEWSGPKSSASAINGVVPIGKVHPSHRYAVVDTSLKKVKRGEDGELLISGPQVTSGYLNSPEKTADNFVHLGKENAIWYRTGDRVIELEDGTLQFLGRIDHQMQIRGYRVEAAEVESALRRVPGVIEAIVLPVDEFGGVVVGLHAFILSQDGDGLCERALQYCREQLPEYMVPMRCSVLRDFPVTANGKIDRKILILMENKT